MTVYVCGPILDVSSRPGEDVPFASVHDAMPFDVADQQAAIADLRALLVSRVTAAASDLSQRIEAAGTLVAALPGNPGSQARGARLVHPVKRGSEAAIAGDEVRPALEDLRGQTGWHGFRLPGEGTSNIKSAGWVTAGHDLDRADCLRPSRLCGVERILCGRGA